MVKIPRVDEPTIPTQIANQPNIPMGFGTAPGRELQRMGQTITQVAAKLTAESNKQQEYETQLRQVQLQNKLFTDYTNSTNNYTTEQDPNKWHAGSREKLRGEIDTFINSAPEHMRPRLKVWGESLYGSFDRRYHVFAQGHVRAKFVAGITGAINSEFGKFGVYDPKSGPFDPEKFSGAFGQVQAGVEKIISAAPGLNEQKKQELRDVAGRAAAAAIMRSVPPAERLNIVKSYLGKYGMQIGADGQVQSVPRQGDRNGPGGTLWGDKNDDYLSKEKERLKKILSTGNIEGGDGSVANLPEEEKKRVQSRIESIDSELGRRREWDRVRANGGRVGIAPPQQSGVKLNPFVAEYLGAEGAAKWRAASEEEIHREITRVESRALKIKDDDAREKEWKKKDALNFILEEKLLKKQNHQPEGGGSGGKEQSGPSGGVMKVITSGVAKRRPYGWTRYDQTWAGLNSFEKAAAMALMEANGMRLEDARNALSAMINRAAKGGEDIGAHVSGAIYEPTRHGKQQARLTRILQSPQFRQLLEWAKQRASGSVPDPVNGATHFLAPERVMLQLESRNPRLYRSWRSWTGFDSSTGQYRGVITRDGSHAFLAPEGKYAFGGSGGGDGGSFQIGGTTLRLSTVQDHAARVLMGQVPQLLRAHEQGIKKAVDGLYDNAKAGYLIPPQQLEELGRQVESYATPQTKARYLEAMRLATTIDALNKNHPARNKAWLDSLRTQFRSTPPTPEQLKMFKRLEEVVTAQAGKTKTDQLTWANNAGVIKMQPLNIDDEEMLRGRLANVQKAAETYGVSAPGQEPRIHYFTAEERNRLSKTLMTPPTQEGAPPPIVAVTERLVKAWGASHARRALAELGQSGAGAQALLGGHLVMMGSTPVSRDAGEGLLLRAQKGYKPPFPIKAEDINDAMRKGLGLTFQAMPQTTDALRQLATAAYENRARKLGWTAFNPDKYNEVVLEILGQRTVEGRTYGGIQNQTSGGNGPVLVPPDVMNGVFARRGSAVARWSVGESLMDLVTTKMLTKWAGDVPRDRLGNPISEQRWRSSYLISIGDGRYYVTSKEPSSSYTKGDTPLDHLYTNKFGTPYVFDFANVRETLRASKSDWFIDLPGAGDPYAGYEDSPG